MASSPKTILITGAASGFGRGVAMGLARKGHRVIAGCQIWESRHAAKAEGLSIEAIKLTGFATPPDRVMILP